jgi:hypothetical protein
MDGGEFVFIRADDAIVAHRDDRDFVDASDSRARTVASAVTREAAYRRSALVLAATMPCVPALVR